MGKCEFCGEQIDLPFQCPFCNGYFCIQHRLPENHSCINAPPRTPLGSWKAKIHKHEPKELPSIPRRTPPSNLVNCPKCGSERTMIAAVREGFDVFECLKCHHKWKHLGGVSERDLKKKEPRIAMPKLKTYAFGLMSGVLALISLILPWWYFQMSTSILGVSFSTTVTADLYKVMISTRLFGEGGEIPYATESTAMNMWFAQITLYLILVGGILAIVGGVISGKIGRNTLIFAGVLFLLSIIVYAYGLQSELLKLTDELINYPYNLKDFPRIQLFSFGAYSHPDYPVPSWDYSSYLYVGFWLDLIATILAFMSARRH